MKFVHHRKRSYRLEKPSLQVLEYIYRSVPKTHWHRDDDRVTYVDLKYVVPVAQIHFKVNGNLDYTELPEYERNQLEEFFKKHFNTTQSSDSYAILHLLPTAPRLIVDAAWKALARTHHPDVGGDPELFRKYQEAYDKIKG